MSYETIMRDMMIYTKTLDKRKKTTHSPDLLHSTPELLVSEKVSEHVTESLQILRCVREGDYAAISKRLATGQSMMSVREPGTGSTIAHLAARCGHKAILKLLLRKYSHYTKMSNNNGRTALHEAAEHGKFVCLTYLLQHGAVCNTRDSSGTTPLMLSAQNGHLQTLRRLGLTDPDSMVSHDMGGYTALHHAASRGHKEVVRWLVEFGVEDLGKDTEGNTVMHLAVSNSHLRCAVWLQHFSKCDVRNINKRGYNSCHIAAERGHVPILHWLLSNQLASPDEPGGQDGSTAVHAAASSGQLESLRCLRMYNANMHKKTFSDKTPKDLATSNKHQECVRYLETIKKPKHEKSQKRANSLTRFVQSLSISGTETPPSSKTKSNKKKKEGGGLSDSENDVFISWPRDKLNFASMRTPDRRSGSVASGGDQEDNRSLYSNGSGPSGPAFRQNSWVGSQVSSEFSPSSTGFDIMQVMRDEKRRQLRYSDQESCDNFSIRSGGSRHRSVSLIGSQEVLDRGGYCSPMGEPSRASMNSNDFEFRLSSPAPEMASVSDRSSLALSDSSGETSGRRDRCPIHGNPAKIATATGDFKKIFNERQSVRTMGRCNCGPMIGDPEVPVRNSSLSRGSTGSDLAISPCSFGNTTLRRQQSELGRLNLESFKSSWGTKTLSPGGAGPMTGPIRSNSNQNFGHGNGRLTSPWGTVQQAEEFNENNKCHTRDGTTFRTSTNLSDICKL